MPRTVMPKMIAPLVGLSIKPIRAAVTKSPEKLKTTIG